VNPDHKNFPIDAPRDDQDSLRASIARALLYGRGTYPEVSTPQDWYQAVAGSVRERLVERWMETTRMQRAAAAKHIYYLSMEFLVGRTLSNALHALGLYDELAATLRTFGLDLEETRQEEPDAALGNGGLGRLAACFLDSMATLGLPSFGYGIRYDYGMFAQHVLNGYQVEQPDDWLKYGNPWEFPRPDTTYPVYFGGWVKRDNGNAQWIDTENVLAMAYDVIVPGHGTRTVSTLRLWHAKAAESLDLALFNQGDYMRAVSAKNLSENVTRVLYPDDSSYQGRELRLRQEYFFVSASVQDILHRYMLEHPHFDALPIKVAIHLNDTHPAIAVPEFMRLLLDVHRLEWADAWSMCTQIFSYTNHTLMPEALETWPLEMMRSVLPRHLDIIFEINKRFLNEVRARFGDDADLLSRVSLINESGERRIRMAHLSVVASHKVNGVSKLHSQLIVESIFADFARIYPDRFCNMTNGITPRRWLVAANRGLADLLDTQLGTVWQRNLTELARLREHADDSSLINKFAAVKADNKAALARWVRRELGVTIDARSLFDVQVKRMHEYKRQLLNALHVVARYQAILDNPDAGWVPRTVLFAGKAASAYRMAKLIIKLINDIAARINHDARVNHLLKVLFVPNYSVSLAELIIPAADLSEQISTAGTEASGTGNMKFALNGALTIGTLDGANIEIGEVVGAENIFIFGLTAAQVASTRTSGYRSQDFYDRDPVLRRVLEAISAGDFSPDDPHRFMPIVDSLLQHGDHYLLLADFASYCQAQARVDTLYRDQAQWHRRALLNVAGMGPFSSDRTIAEYAEQIWHVRPVGDGGLPV
jgi:glycogen phosphorylase